MTYREALSAGTLILEKAGVPEPELDSWYLLTHVSGLSRADYYLRQEEALSEEEQRHFEAAVRERSERIPLQYLLGTQEFMGLTLLVNSHVLIPRQDTETLVEAALSDLTDGMNVLDLCTGSGCIALALKKNCPNATVTGSDNSKQALLVAKENAKRCGTEITFVRSDLFENLTGPFDLIVSNPPYIRSSVIPTLQPEVADFEPIEALDGHEDGLFFYRRIASSAPEYLNPGGRLMLEIGHDQAAAVSGLLTQAGFSDIHVKKDLANNDRVLTAGYP